jgi:hypothetical protein
MLSSSTNIKAVQVGHSGQIEAMTAAVREGCAPLLKLFVCIAAEKKSLSQVDMSISNTSMAQHGMARLGIFSLHQDKFFVFGNHEYEDECACADDMTSSSGETTTNTSDPFFPLHIDSQFHSFI